MTLPAEYLAYCAADALMEGELLADPGWFQLWPPAEVEQFNRDYMVAEFAPGVVGFGSNGGGELFAFESTRRVIALPMVGMSLDDALPVAESWSAFVALMKR